MSGSALACNPHGIPAEEREEHFARIERLFGSAVERRELPDGLAFSFAAEAFPEAARFVDNERRCCPFLAFTLELRPDSGPLTLRLTGPDGIREFLAAELDLDRSA